MSITRFEPDYYKMVHILDGDWVHYSAHMDEVNALRAKIKQLSVDAARLCSRGNRLERENANLQAMCDELSALCNELSKLILEYSGSCPFDFYESKRGMPCEFDDTQCHDNKDGECWVAYARLIISENED